MTAVLAPRPEVRPRRLTIRLWGVLSGVILVRQALVVLALVPLLFVALCVAVSVGDFDASPWAVAQALFNHGDFYTVFTVRELRLPRALTGLLIGVGFGISGALFQTMARNPLASPDVIGITQGAGTATVAGIVFGFGAGLGGRPALALLGGLASATAIYLLAWRRGTTGYRIVLVGIGVSAMCLAATNYLLVKAQLFQVQDALVWLVGDLNAKDWPDVRTAGIPMIVLVPLAVFAAYRLRTLELGDDAARALGTAVQRARLALMAAGVGLVAFATAVAGPVLFTALMAPQIAQRLVRAPNPPVIASGLVGALIVVLADLVAQHAIPGVQLPVGVVTGAVGGPFLLWLLVRTNTGD